MRKRVWFKILPFFWTGRIKREFIVIRRIGSPVTNSMRVVLIRIVELDSLRRLMLEIDIIKVGVVDGHFANVIT